ncbi:hypothetical protein ZOSMA_33G00630 [Zostera marina]|uniref:Uncharacterized protein n=1 Tax=Zostera marina TaxID=29655 RepID=A0A0K9P9U6_ZOSMR|nr:hypothetical protein ZOSMA_33G00630 [Zostera marina]
MKYRYIQNRGSMGDQEDKKTFMAMGNVFHITAYII